MMCEALLSQDPISNVLSAKEKLPGSGSVVKNPPANAGDLGSIPESGRSPERGNGNPLQCCCLGNPMDRGAWCVTVRGVAQSWIQLSRHTHTHTECMVLVNHVWLMQPYTHTHECIHSPAYTLTHMHTPSPLALHGPLLLVVLEEPTHGPCSCGREPVTASAEG